MAQDKSMISVRKKVKELNDVIQDTFIAAMEDYHIPEIQNIILQEYDIELTGRVTDRRSRTNPIYYRDDFKAALLSFDYLDFNSKETTLITPETNTFNWRQGRLRVIQTIVEGAIGSFIEVDEEQYMTLFGKRPIIQPFDGTVPLKERIYLLKWAGDTQRRWNEVFSNRSAVAYPFSNTPPIDIFDGANRYVQENMKKWIDEIIKDAQKEITR